MNEIHVNPGMTVRKMKTLHGVGIRPISSGNVMIS